MQDLGELDPLLSCCLALDLEIGKGDGRIHAFGAVRADTGKSWFIQVATYQQH